MTDPYRTEFADISVPAIDLKAQYASIRDEIDAAVGEVFASQHFIMGPQVRECEEAIAEYSQCHHGVGVSSGTDALLIALMAEDIGPGDEVITTPYSFFATGGCVARLGATPVFADIDPVSFNLCPNQIESCITEKTKAIIPVHLFGLMADMDPIMEIARSRNLVVIEDAAQAIGAEYKGQRAGSIGDYGCFSFFPAKNLGCAGDGGMVVTQDDDRAERLRVLRVHGSKPKYFHKVIGGNFRLDTLNAAIVLAKLKHLGDWTAARQKVARQYIDLLSDAGLIDRGLVTSPLSPVDDTAVAVQNQFVCRVTRRDELLAHLKAANIATAVYYPRSLHEQECFQYLGHEHGDFPVAEGAAANTLALPIFPELTTEQIQYVAEKVIQFYG